jgi:nuclease HARBI1
MVSNAASHCFLNLVLYFRFTVREILELCRKLHLPDEVTVNRHVWLTHNALAVYLAYLAFPVRQETLAQQFGRSRTSVCLVINALAQILYDRYALKVSCDLAMWVARATTYAHVISTRIPFFNTIVGFIDGTARQICRPIRDQRQVYSGHHRVHCLKYQSVVTPDGLIISLYGPFDGRHHDLYMVGQSCINEIMHADPVLNTLCLYGDKGYVTAGHIVAGLRRPAVTDDASVEFNAVANASRVCVEHGFGRVVSLFPALSFPLLQRMLLSPVACHYINATLFTNIRTCFDGGNQIADMFTLRPPTLDEYL